MASNGAAQPDAIPNEFILSFYDARDRARFIALARAKGLDILGSMDFGNAVRVRARREQLDALLGEAPRPIGSSPNYYVRMPDPESWGRNPRAPADGYVGFGSAALRWLGAATDRTGWGNGILVAVLDTGLDAHPALNGVQISREDLVGTAGGSALAASHGTAVASLIAGRSRDVAGLAPEASLLSIRVLADDGTGDTFTLAQGIVAAVDAGAQVINICLGSRGDSFLVREAIGYARQKGVAIIAAVGNDAVEGVLYPARYDGVVAVTAVDAEGQHLFFANRGPEVALAAPGAGVFAASTNQQLGEFSGTSAAVPFVSGAVAELLSRNPGLSADKAVALLAEYANDAGAPGADDEYGSGILDLGRVDERNVAGLRDVAACNLYLRPCASANEDPLLIVSAQNRGTEDLYCVYLDVTLDGASARQNFYNVKSGQTVSYEQRVSLARLRQGEIPVLYRASIDGGGDVNPANDARRGSVSVRNVVVEQGD